MRESENQLLQPLRTSEFIVLKEEAMVRSTPERARMDVSVRMQGALYSVQQGLLQKLSGLQHLSYWT